MTKNKSKTKRSKKRNKRNNKQSSSASVTHNTYQSEHVILDTSGNLSPKPEPINDKVWRMSIEEMQTPHVEEGRGDNVGTFERYSRSKSVVDKQTLKVVGYSLLALVPIGFMLYQEIFK